MYIYIYIYVIVYFSTVCHSLYHSICKILILHYTNMHADLAGTYTDMLLRYTIISIILICYFIMICY